MHDFEVFCASLAKCRKCRDLIPEIGDLPENEFKFHWRPYLRGLPPLRFLFLGWEPSWPKSWHEVEEGIFSEPLQFAIRDFKAVSTNPVWPITAHGPCNMLHGLFASC